MVQWTVDGEKTTPSNTYMRLRGSLKGSPHFWGAHTLTYEIHSHPRSFLKGKTAKALSLSKRQNPLLWVQFNLCSQWLARSLIHYFYSRFSITVLLRFFSLERVSAFKPMLLLLWFHFSGLFSETTSPERHCCSLLPRYLPSSLTVIQFTAPCRNLSSRYWKWTDSMIRY